MGWFDEQIHKRIEKDEALMEKSLLEMGEILMGKSSKAAILLSQRWKTVSALEDICKFYGITDVEIADKEDINEQLEETFTSLGIMHRQVTLQGAWWKEAAGAYLGELKNGDTVALIPKGVAGYEYFDYTLGKKVRLNKKTVKNLKPTAVCFYRTLPQRTLVKKDIYHFLLESVSNTDKLAIILVSLIVALLGLISPKVNELIFSQVIPAGAMSMVLSSAILLTTVTISMFFFRVMQSSLKSKVQEKMSAEFQNAVIGRVLHLPAAFFKEYSAGKLAEKVICFNTLPEHICNAAFGIGLTSIFSIVYVAQIGVLTPTLVIPTVLILALQLGISLSYVKLRKKRMEKQIQEGEEVNGIVFALFQGIRKIRLSGAEKRAFSKWAGIYKKQAEAKFNHSFFLKLESSLTAAVWLGGMVVLYLQAYRTGVEVSEYIAFQVAYGILCTTLMNVTAMVWELALIEPIFEMGKAIMDTSPELTEQKQTVKRLSGQIEINNLSFRYSENGPLIFDNLNLKIRRGQYVAIVGSTGCGKSTLLRLLLGFETPLKGAIYYDRMELRTINLKSLRRKIGVVMQNGKLFQGDIFSNITISNPNLTMEEAWEAAECADIAEDIRDMPMGMGTIISEGSGGISGGQRQRLLIARAIAPKPKILMFDEATSALDNITQKQVSDSLEKLSCTRIVIAHRLSTIVNCDRIIVLDKGRIIEDGTYAELMAQNGFFAELVRRQQVE